MSELLDKWLNSADFRKGYDRGRDDGRREPTFGQRRHFMLISDRLCERKGSAWCEGYLAGYEETYHS